MFSMVSLQVLITGSVVLIAWMRYTSATQESAYEFESRLRNNFGVSAGETKKMQNRTEKRVYTEIEQVIFEESTDPFYILKRTFWPWQEISGWAKFSIKTNRFVIEDTSEFEETLPENATLEECDHEHHSNHYYVEVEGDLDYEGHRMEGFDTLFYYIANSKHITLTHKADAGTITIEESDETDDSNSTE